MPVNEKQPFAEGEFTIQLSDIIESIRKFLRERLSRNLGLDLLDEVVETSPCRLSALLLISGFLLYPSVSETKAWSILREKFFTKYLPEILFLLADPENRKAARIPVKEVQALLQLIVGLLLEDVLFEVTIHRLTLMTYAHFDTGYTLEELKKKMNNMTLSL